MLVLAAVLLCAVATGALAHYVGVGPAGCMIAASAAAAAASALTVFIFTHQRPAPTTTANHTPKTKPPAQQENNKPKGKKNPKGGKKRK
ncbi:hypothetical protein [Streptomyces sp. NBC_01465]|uniref:hypothetical protein n=1 Tax=Streptomyces sp. NBC_01465 TaxID=2903878 RepID=UPI002E3227F6|nr:hypothetical protein [Streptomyces sp. NBC_01465]